MIEQAQALQPIPIVPLRGGAVFPGTTTTISLTRSQSLEAAQYAHHHDGKLLLLVQHNADVDYPKSDDLTAVGVLGTVRDILKAPHMTVQMLVELHERVHFDALIESDPFLKGTYSQLESVTDSVNTQLILKAIAYLEQYAEALGETNSHISTHTRSKRTTGELADYIAGLLNMPLETEIDLLMCLDGEKRLEKITEQLNQELHIAEIRNKIQRDARDGADKAQREYLLREQMRAIRKELGDDGESAIDELRNSLEQMKLPEAVFEQVTKELKRLEYQGPQSAESGVIRTYLEWIKDLPWHTSTADNFDIAHVRRVLDQDHYGLQEVKERIIEFVAVRKLAGNAMRGAIINLYGPPGVGKTSIAQSVGRALGREVIRISLGGVRDESEIRGHRRTYIGAMPGRILRALRDAGTNNPIIVLDEIDKIGSDWRGDPAAALLEVLDPEQNSTFTDHYLDLPFDLSQVIFITTSNHLNTIPSPLLDRMETITMPGYIESEKVCIAQEYLLKKQQEGHGVAETAVAIHDETLRLIIRHYTREAGVRELERVMGKIVRKIAVKVASGSSGPFLIDEATVSAFLGPKKYQFGTAEEQDEVGVVMGLGVSSFGGDTLPIEVSLSEGNGRVTLTGSLGDIMQESAQAALTYARANARELGLKPTLFDAINIHIHVPDGATPKDGPSAGISMATALISALTNRPVRRDLAMTGEVTLRGKVLAIGGLKAKTIAAHRAGIKTVLLPKDNAKDIVELPESIRADIELIPVAHLREVLSFALLEHEAEPYRPNMPLQLSKPMPTGQPVQAKRATTQ